MAQILQINRVCPETDLIKTAVKKLADGALVIVPTETVYGIACNPSIPGAMENLMAAKGRDGNKPIARLAASSQQVKQTATHWNEGLQALADAYWPGSLTIVLETADGWTGYRIPDHLVPLALANACGCSLALTSANLSGDPDTKTAQEAMNAVNADLVIDSGASAEQAIPSTVIKVDGEQLQCLREGRIPFSEIEAIFYQERNRS